MRRDSWRPAPPAPVDDAGAGRDLHGPEGDLRQARSRGVVEHARQMQATSYTALTPLAFLERAADVFADKTAIAYGDRRSTYAEFGAEATRLAHALQASGVRPGDRVAYLCPNIPEMLVANFGVPLAGAVLVPINHRLSAEEVRYIWTTPARRCWSSTRSTCRRWRRCWPVLRTVPRWWRSRTPSDRRPRTRARLAHHHLRRAASARLRRSPAVDGRRRVVVISINYTSGTTGPPKGVMYAHRGAYLNALGEIIHQRFDPESVYLWTLPMFHCNGWCTPWAVTAIGATHVCLRAVRPDMIWRLFDEERVTHLDGAPTVLTMIADSPQAHRWTATGGDGRRGPAEPDSDRADARTRRPDRARLRDDRGLRPVRAQRVAGRAGRRCRRATRRAGRPVRAWR